MTIKKQSIRSGYQMFFLAQDRCRIESVSLSVSAIIISNNILKGKGRHGACNIAACYLLISSFLGDKGRRVAGYESTAPHKWVYFFVPTQTRSTHSITNDK